MAWVAGQGLESKSFVLRTQGRLSHSALEARVHGDEISQGLTKACSDC